MVLNSQILLFIFTRSIKKDLISNFKHYDPSKVMNVQFGEHFEQTQSEKGHISLCIFTMQPIEISRKRAQQQSPQDFAHYQNALISHRLLR